MTGPNAGGDKGACWYCVSMKQSAVYATFGLVLAASIAASMASAPASRQSDVKSIEARLGGLWGLSDDKRAVVTKALALEIRSLSRGQTKLGLALSLANLATEGDFGPGTIQEVATTLAGSLTDLGTEAEASMMDSGFMELAQLVRYEHVAIDLRSPAYAAAIKKLDAIDAARGKADFSLSDIDGKIWTLSKLKGKVVVVNFWATWCPPCRKEMPDLQALADRFKSDGLVILAISDEDAAKVKSFIADHGYRYPILLDPGRKVNGAYAVDGIPKSFIYDRKGKLVAEAMDMRTRAQFLKLLAKAGLKASN